METNEKLEWYGLSLRNECEVQYLEHIFADLKNMYFKFNKTFKLDLYYDKYRLLEQYADQLEKKKHFEAIGLDPAVSMLRLYVDYYKNPSIFEQIINQNNDQDITHLIGDFIYSASEYPIDERFDEIFSAFRKQLMEIGYESGTINSCINEMEAHVSSPLKLIIRDCGMFSDNFKLFIILNYLILLNYVIIRKLLIDYYDNLITDYISPYKVQFKAFLKLLKDPVFAGSVVNDSKLVRIFETYLDRVLEPIPTKEYFVKQFKLNTKPFVPERKLHPRERFELYISNKVRRFGGDFDKLVTYHLVPNEEEKKLENFKTRIDSTPLTHICRMFNMEESYLFYSLKHPRDDRNPSSYMEYIEGFGTNISYINHLHHTCALRFLSISFDKLTILLTRDMYKTYSLQNFDKVDYFKRYLIVHLAETDDLILSILLFKFIQIFDNNYMWFTSIDDFVDDFLKTHLFKETMDYFNFYAELESVVKKLANIYAPDYFENPEQFYDDHFPKIREFPGRDKYILDKFINFWIQPEEEYVDPLWKKISGGK